MALVFATMSYSNFCLLSLYEIRGEHDFLLSIFQNLIFSQILVTYQFSNHT